MGDNIKVYSSNYDAKKLIMINPLYNNVEEYTDPSTNIVYPGDISRNYVNFTGDISNNDRLTFELSHYNENTLQDYIAGAKRNFLDLSLNHDLHSLLLWGQNNFDNYPTEIYDKDLEIPVITLLGDTEISLFVNDNYVEPGYSALDNIDGVITNKVVVTGSVNTALEGIYDISYDVTDSLGNKAITVVRKVTITEKPIELPTLSMIARYNSSSWVNNTTWNDMTGNNKHMVNVEAGTSQVITAENADMTQNNGRAFPYVKGNWNSRWNVYDSSTTFTDYTLVFITRYDPDGNPSDYSHITHHQWGRILEAQNNTHWGHAWQNAHRVTRNNYKMTDANGQTADDLYGSTPNPTFEWCFGICTPQSFICRGSDKLTEWHVADQVINSHGTPRVTIRNGMYSNECAHWHIAELIMYDRIVTNDEIDTIKAWIEENFILTDN